MSSPSIGVVVVFKTVQFSTIIRISHQKKGLSCTIVEKPKFVIPQQKLFLHHAK